MPSQKGCSLLLVVLATIILIATGITIFNLFIKNSTFYTTVLLSKEEKLKNKPTLYNLGVNFDKFDPSSGKAGDFLFTREKIFEDRLFLEFGYVVKNGQVQKVLPHPTYFLPQGTKIIAISPGKVLGLRSQKDSNDYELLVQPKDAPGWRIAYDHLENVRFKKGDTVKTGDIVGEVTAGYNSGSGNFTMTEITVFIEGTKPEDIENYCPYMLLENSVKDQYAQKILQFAKDWEEYTDNPAMYDEKSWVFPGCRYEKLNETNTMK